MLTLAIIALAANLGAWGQRQKPVPSKPAPAQAIVDYWQRTMKSLDAFAPQALSDGSSAQLTFYGWRDRKYEARVRWGEDSMPVVVVVGNVSSTWSPPLDGRTWIMLPPLQWSATGLPDPDGYCLREQALVIEQAARVVEKLRTTPVRMTIIADGLVAGAAMAVATGDPTRVAGVMLVEPDGYQNMSGGRVLLDGWQGRALKHLADTHPTWKTPMTKALGCFDLANLGATSKAPVVVLLGSGQEEDWIDNAQTWWQWQCVNVKLRKPTVASVLQARWFDGLWADVTGEA